MEEIIGKVLVRHRKSNSELLHTHDPFSAILAKTHSETSSPNSALTIFCQFCTQGPFLAKTQEKSCKMCFKSKTALKVIKSMHKELSKLHTKQVKLLSEIQNSNRKLNSKLEKCSRQSEKIEAFNVLTQKLNLSHEESLTSLDLQREELQSLMQTHKFSIVSISKSLELCHDFSKSSQSNLSQVKLEKNLLIDSLTQLRNNLSSLQDANLSSFKALESTKTFTSELKSHKKQSKKKQIILNLIQEELSKITALSLENDELSKEVKHTEESTNSAYTMDETSTNHEGEEIAMKIKYQHDSISMLRLKMLRNGQSLESKTCTCLIF